MDLMDDSIVVDTVAQCSYNTAYRALRGIRSTNTKLGKKRVLDVVM